MAKKPKAIKCEKCGLEFTDSELSEEHKNKGFIYKDKLLCEDCLIMIGGDPRTTQTLWGFRNDQNKTQRHDW